MLTLIVPGCCEVVNKIDPGSSKHCTASVWDSHSPYVLLALSREWMGMGVAGIIINNYYPSFPHSLLSTNKM